MDRRYNPLINERVEAAFSQLRKRLSYLEDNKNSIYVRFRCRRALLDIEYQAQFLSSSSVDVAELDTLLGKA